jgi:excisionase family DNA binding protein
MKPDEGRPKLSIVAASAEVSCEAREWLSVAPLGVKPIEAGRILGESRNTVYRLLADGKLRAVKRGTTTLIIVSSIRQYFDSLPIATFGADRAT